MIKYAIFDLDGTLLDTLEAIRYYVNITLEKYGATPISREECRQFVGRGAKVLITMAMQSRGMDMARFDEVFLDYNKAYNSNPYYLTHPYEGIPELIDGLLSRGVTLAVLSNKPQIATEGALNHFIPGKFAAVFGGREGKPLKPDKAALDEVMSALGATADEVAYIGDSDVDVLTMKASSPKMGIAVSYGFRTKDELIASGADVILESPLAVLDYIIKNA